MTQGSLQGAIARRCDRHLFKVRTPSVIVPDLSQQMVEVRPIFSTAMALATELCQRH